ncbi:hypothetical protein JL722_1820 [Aureococcus anophagefferens]|nr:hypothetical protein JL722_1820 [Aureococcus anophagefferens]
MAAAPAPRRRPRKKKDKGQTFESIKRAVDALGVELEQVAASSTDFDLRRAVGKMVAASAPNRRPLGAPGGPRVLGADEARAWMRRFLRLSLSAAGVAAVLGLLPDSVVSGAGRLFEDGPRRVDAALVVALFNTLGEVQRERVARRRGGAEPRPRPASAPGGRGRPRPASAPAARPAAWRTTNLRRLSNLHRGIHAVPVETRRDADIRRELADAKRSLERLARDARAAAPSPYAAHGAAMGKLLAAALHHEPGCLEAFPPGPLGPAAFDHLARRFLDVDGLRASPRALRRRRRARRRAPSAVALVDDVAALCEELAGAAAAGDAGAADRLRRLERSSRPRRTRSSGSADLAGAHADRAKASVLGRLGAAAAKKELKELEAVQDRCRRMQAAMLGNETSKTGATYARKSAYAARTPLARAKRKAAKLTGFDARIQGSIVATIAAQTIQRAGRKFLFRRLRAQMQRAQDEWYRLLEAKARKALARAMRAYKARRDHAKRVGSLQGKMEARARAVIGRCILRKVREDRKRRSADLEAALAAEAAAPPARQLSDDEAAIHVQARFRAIDTRARAAKDLRVADAKWGTSDPVCYVSFRGVRHCSRERPGAVLLRSRRGSATGGSYAPKGCAPPEGSFQKTLDDYKLVEQRNVNSQHKHNEQTQAYLEQIRGKKQDEGERSEEMDRRRELVRKHTLFSAHLDRALKFKMIEENQPFWMPPIVRSRDFDKFVAYPPKFQCFSHKTRAIEKTLHPCWNDACFVAGVDPESLLAFTVVDVDQGDNHDDFLGQVTVPMKVLRHADSLAVLAAEQLRRDRKAQGLDARGVRLKRKRQSLTMLMHVDRDMGRDVHGMIKVDAHLRGALLVHDAYKTLGKQTVPVVEPGAAKQVHLDDIHVPPTGHVWYRVWAAPRTTSVCGFVEMRCLRRSLITFWKPAWACLAFGRLRVYDHRGEAEPKLEIDMDHVDLVEAHKDHDEGDSFVLQVAGAGLHHFRVADIGHPIRSLQFSNWVRRLRRAAPRIPTNEFVASEASFAEYLGHAVKDPVTRPRRSQIREIQKRHDAEADAYREHRASVAAMRDAPFNED